MSPGGVAPLYSLSGLVSERGVNVAAGITDKPTVGIREDAVEPPWTDLRCVGARLPRRRMTSTTHDIHHQRKLPLHECSPLNEPPPGVGSVRLPTMSRPLCAKLAAAKFNCLINNDKNYGMPLAVLMP